MTDPVVTLFDQVADVYDDVVPFFGEFGSVTSTFLPPPPRPGARLLDVGAGRGAIALPAREAGYQVTAIDASSGMVRRLGAEHPDLDVSEMDAADLTFDDGTFDVVTAGFVMHLLPDPQRAAAEIRRVLREDGLFVFTVLGRVPDGFVSADLASGLFGEFAQYLPPQGGMGAPFDVTETLTGAGFGDVTERDIRVEIPLAGPDELWRWLGTHGTRKFLNDLDEMRREEFRERLRADLAARDRAVLRRYAWLYTARR